MGLIAVEHALAQRSIMDGAEKLQTQCLELLRSFRSLCPPTAKTSGALLLPDGLKLLPLYTLGLMKGGLFAANDATRADDRSALMHHFSCAPTPRSTAMLHPRLVQVYPPQQAMPATALPRLLPPPQPKRATGLRGSCGSARMRGRATPRTTRRTGKVKKTWRSWRSTSRLKAPILTKPTLKVLKTWRFDAEFLGRAGHEAALPVSEVMSEIISNQVGLY